MRGFRPTKLSLTPQVTYLRRSAPGPRRGQLATLTLVHLPSHFVLRHSFVSDVARGRNLTPDGSSHLVLHAILDVWHAWHKTFIS